MAAAEPDRAFRVIAGSAEVVDLGTKFDVRLQHDSTVVTVIEGRVAVHCEADRDRDARATESTNQRGLCHRRYRGIHCLSAQRKGVRVEVTETRIRVW